MTKKKEKETTSTPSFYNSLQYLPLLSGVACLILGLLFVGMYFSKGLHILITVLMFIASGVMFYGYFKNKG